MARGKDLSDFERGFIVEAQMARASVTISTVSIRTVNKVTSAFRSKGMSSGNKGGNCG